MIRVAIGPVPWSPLAHTLPSSGENPGVGGTSHVAALLAIRLSQVIDLEVSLVVRGCIPKLDAEASSLKILQEEVDRSFEFDIRVIPVASFTSSQLISHFQQDTARCILWSHHPHDQKLRYLMHTGIPDAVVSLGMYQYASNDWVTVPHYLVANPFPRWTSSAEYVEYNKRPKTAGVSGALDPSKNFHKLARYWNEITASWPGIELDVLGSSSLYTGISPTGSLIPTSSEYELRILKAFKIGDVPTNVRFHGNVPEKVDFMKYWRAAFLNLT